MTTLPIDIERKTNQLFIDVKDIQEVKKLLLSLWTTTLNVGEDQLARSILTISGGDVQKLKDVFKDFYGDPRDVIMTAERLLGNPGHYFIPTFDEIEMPTKLK
ncbi:MAG: hypothetical protein V4547_19195 [Bacteroidota bacterium]